MVGPSSGRMVRANGHLLTQAPASRRWTARRPPPETVQVRQHVLPPRQGPGGTRPGRPSLQSLWGTFPAQRQGTTRVKRSEKQGVGEPLLLDEADGGAAFAFAACTVARIAAACSAAAPTASRGAGTARDGESSPVTVTRPARPRPPLARPTLHPR